MSKVVPFTGCATALVTPFDRGEIDYRALGLLIDRQIDKGADALAVCATTGEASSLCDAEKFSLIEFTVKYVSRKIPVIAGVGSNCTEHACKLAREAQAAGADALLAVSPYYVKANDEGMIAHFSAIAASTYLPVILYNVPSRTGQSISLPALASLAGVDNIVGIKEAGNDIVHTANIARECRDGLRIYSGNDDRILPILSLSGAGVISVVSNLLPEKVCRICSLFRQGREEEATADQLEILPLSDALFCEVNPIPVKWALYLMGLIKPEYRLPLCLPSESAQRRISEQLEKFGLI